MSLIS